MITSEFRSEEDYQPEISDNYMERLSRVDPEEASIVYFENKKYSPFRGEL